MSNESSTEPASPLLNSSGFTPMTKSPCPPMIRFGSSSTTRKPSWLSESHDGFLVVELDPKRIIGGHGDFVMGVKPDEFKRGLAGSVDDSLDIGVGDANDRVAAAVAATGATKL